jgi:superfamily II DNA helicase RecQ
MHCFAVPALHPEPAQTELNEFLARERVLAVRREFIADGANSAWVFCVELVSGPGPLPAALRAAGSRAADAPQSRPRADAVDYKLLLSEPDFALFAALRSLRKQLAQAEGVPVYAVFSNEQLAAIVTRQAQTRAALGEIEGIGPARLDKYAGPVLACLQAQRALQGAPGAPAAVR